MVVDTARGEDAQATALARASAKQQLKEQRERQEAKKRRGVVTEDARQTDEERWAEAARAGRWALPLFTAVGEDRKSGKQR